MAKRDPLHNIAVTETQLTHRLLDLAREYRSYAPIPRMAIFDITYPANSDEYHEMNGFGIIVITSLTQVAEEHPLAQCYIEYPGGRQDLKAVMVIPSDVPEIWCEIIETFGPHRLDSLYLFPMYLRNESAEVLVDFAKNKNAMVVARFPLKDLVENLPKDAPISGHSNTDAIRCLIERELPAFAEFLNPHEP